MSGSKFKPSAECSNKAIRLGCLPECGAESDSVVQNAHRVQVGYTNTPTVEPTADFKEMISDREITGAYNFNTPHWTQSFGFICQPEYGRTASTRLSIMALDLSSSRRRTR